MKEEKTDLLLALWLDGKVSDQELEEFYTPEEIQKLKIMVKEMDTWSLPEVSTEFDFSKTSKHDTKVRRLYPISKIITIVALFIISVGFFSIWWQNRDHLVEHKTLANETKSIILPDSSIALINGLSTLSYDKNWETRTIKLSDSAYLKIKYGEKFTVSYPNGSTQVMGTKFEVVTSPSVHKVVCFEGKVKVSCNQDESTLLPGQGVRMNIKGTLDHFTSSNKEPNWVAGQYYIFKYVPFDEVL